MPSEKDPFLSGQKEPFALANKYSLDDIIKEAKHRHKGNGPIDTSKTEEILLEFSAKNIREPMEDENRKDAPFRPDQETQPMPIQAFQKKRPAEDDELEGQLKLFDSDGVEEPGPVNERVLYEKRRERAEKFVLSGTEEDTDPKELYDADSEAGKQIDDFTSYEDAPVIQAHLNSQFSGLLTRLGLSVLGLLITGWLTVAPALFLYTGAKLPLYDFPVTSPMLFVSINAAVLMLAASVNSAIFASSLRSAFKLHTAPDMPTAIAVFAVFVHTFSMLFFPERIADMTVPLYTAPVMLLLCANAGGKLLKLSRIKENFAFLSQKGVKHGARMLPNDNTTRDLCRNILGDPYIVMPVKASFLTGFLDDSYADDSCASLGGFLSPCVLLGSLVTAVACLVVTKDGALAITAFAAVCCLAAPIASLLCGNLPMKAASRRLLRRGAMLSGFPAVDDYFLTNSLTVDASDLFPAGSVTLNGIKTFSGGRIDQAILDAAALVHTAGGPLTPVFEQVIQGDDKILPTVESLVYEQGMGISGWVDGRRVLAGNRELLQNHGIVPPSLDYESRYLRARRKLVYLCSAGELCAMFVVTYRFSPYIRQELDRFARNGIGLMVRTCDPNVTTELLCDGFDISESDVLILSAAATSEFDQLSVPQETAQASVAYDGKIDGLMDVLSSSIRLGTIVKLSSVLQVIGVLLGFLLSAFLAFYGGLYNLNGATALLFQLFWLLASLIPSLLRSSS